MTIDIVSDEVEEDMSIPLILAWRSLRTSFVIWVRLFESLIFLQFRGAVVCRTCRVLSPTQNL